MKRLVALSLTVCLLSGCATYRPIVDMRGVDANRYEADLRDCQQYATQVNPGAQAAGGALIGAALVGAIGAILCGRDCAAMGAGVGAVQGAAAGGAEGAGGQVQVIRNCMSGRGYSILR